MNKLFPDRKNEIRQLLCDSYTDNFNHLNLYNRFAKFLYPSINLDYEHITTLLKSLEIDKSIDFFKTLSLYDEKESIFIDFQM